MLRDGPLLMTKLEKKKPFLNMKIKRVLLFSRKLKFACTCEIRITEIFLFFYIFGDRDGDSIVGIKQKTFSISYDKAILSL